MGIESNVSNPIATRGDGTQGCSGLASETVLFSECERFVNLTAPAIDARKSLAPPTGRTLLAKRSNRLQIVLFLHHFFEQCI